MKGEQDICLECPFPECRLEEDSACPLLVNDERRKARREYRREYYKKNREKIRAYRREYYLRCKARKKEAANA